MGAKSSAPTCKPCDVPPWAGDPSALVVIDWSGWLHMAWAIKELDMLSVIVGWLTSRVLAHDPAHLAIALDAGGTTMRHRMAHPSDPDWRYKGDRTPKPQAFFDLCEKADKIAELHKIPLLWAQEREADDVIATVTAQARALGYRVWVATKDKDLHGLIEGEGRSLSVGVWDPFLDPPQGGGAAGAWREAPEVRAKWGVAPEQIADFLAIWGDSGDGVPGVPGLGPGAAAGILRSYDTLDRALNEPAWLFEDFERARLRIDALAKEIKKASEERAAELATERAALMQRRTIERDRCKLIEATEIARFSRDLTALDCDAPVGIPWEELPLGGYDVDGLARRYETLGFAVKAEQIRGVAPFPKRAPWAIP